MIKSKEYRDNYRQLILSQYPGDREIYFFHPRLENILVSNYGNVKNRLTGCIYTPHTNMNGYLCVNVKYFDTSRRSVFVHRLVAEAIFGFLNNKDYIYEVNHIDGNKLNNNISNLEWVTRKENLDHSTKLRLSRKKEYRYLTETEVQDILELKKLGFTYKELAKSYGSSISYLQSICLSKSRVKGE